MPQVGGKGKAGKVRSDLDDQEPRRLETGFLNVIEKLRKRNV